MIEIKLTFNTKEEAATFFAQYLASMVPAPVVTVAAAPTEPATVTPEKQERARTSTKKAVAAPAPAPAEPEAAAPAPAEPEAAAAPTPAAEDEPTLKYDEDVAPVLVKAIARDKAAVIALLEELDARNPDTNAPSGKFLKPSQFGKALERLKTILAD